MFCHCCFFFFFCQLLSAEKKLYRTRPMLGSRPDLQICIQKLTSRRKLVVQKLTIFGQFLTTLRFNRKYLWNNHDIEKLENSIGNDRRSPTISENFTIFGAQVAKFLFNDHRLCILLLCHRCNVRCKQ